MPRERTLVVRNVLAVAVLLALVGLAPASITAVREGSSPEDERGRPRGDGLSRPSCRGRADYFLSFSHVSHFGRCAATSSRAFLQ